MPPIIDVSVNFKPHTQLKLYDVLEIDRATARGVDPDAYLQEMDRNGARWRG